MNSSFHRLKALKLLTTQDSVVAKPLSLAKVMTKAILLDGSEFRLLTAQESAAAKPLLLFQSKSHDWMDSTWETADCARRYSCEATFVYESHD